MSFTYLKIVLIKKKNLHHSIFLMNVMRLESGCDYPASGRQQTLNPEPLQRFSLSSSVPERHHAPVLYCNKIVSVGDYLNLL